MKIKDTLFLLGVVGLISLGGIVVFLFNIDPYKTDTMSLILFYLSVLAFFTAILSIIGWWARIKMNNREVVFANLPIAFRQALLFSCWLVAVLIMSSLKVLTIWDAGILLVSIVFIELFFRARITTKQYD